VSGDDLSVPVEVEEPADEIREIFGLAFSGAARFAEMLTAEGEMRGVIGPRELPRLWSRHIVNSAALAPFLPARGAVADVGSGAGFPGIVIALLRPDLEVMLIESMERRIEWLDDVVVELDLDNVILRHARAEEVKDRFDVVAARAPAPVPTPVGIPVTRSPHSKDRPAWRPSVSVVARDARPDAVAPSSPRRSSWPAVRVWTAR